MNKRVAMKSIQMTPPIPLCQPAVSPEKAISPAMDVQPGFVSVNRPHDIFCPGGPASRSILGLILSG